jgi:hypothetical protein
MGLSERLAELNAELEIFSCRPKTLVPDLVLLALATDVFESGKAVCHTAESDQPHKAYSNARLAFEGAQQVLVLATHEDYETAGASAWVYFESKDAGWRSILERRRDPHSIEAVEEKWLDERVAQMSRVWESVAEGQGALLAGALLTVRRDSRKKPDNWLHEKLTPRQHRAYSLFAAKNGRGAPAETAELNQNMYKALCRETHARPRLDCFRVIHDRARGTVHVRLQPRNLDQARYGVMAGTELSISETIASLRWQRTGAV